MGRAGYRFRIDAGCRLDVNQLAGMGTQRFEQGMRAVGSLRYSSGMELEITAEFSNEVRGGHVTIVQDR